jgi:hypothetical protein
MPRAPFIGFLSHVPCFPCSFRRRSFIHDSWRDPNSLGGYFVPHHPAPVDYRWDLLQSTLCPPQSFQVAQTAATNPQDSAPIRENKIPPPISEMIRRVSHPARHSYRENWAKQVNRNPARRIPRLGQPLSIEGGSEVHQYGESMPPVLASVPLTTQLSFLLN